MSKFHVVVLAILLSAASAGGSVAQDGPTTPVPPVPTAEEIREAHWQAVRELDVLMTACLERQRLLVFLLELDPTGANAPFIQHQLLMERCLMTQLRLQRQWHLDQM